LAAPLACAVARAALRVLVEEGMIENAADQGERFLAGLRSIRSNTIREVRGRGLMLAVELHPEAGDARRYCESLQGRGILAKDTHGRTIRIAPPLVITSDQVDWALEGIEATFRQS
jgi:ornithine--oxo-acid transaminase